MRFSKRGRLSRVAALPEAKPDSLDRFPDLLHGSQRLFQPLAGPAERLSLLLQDFGFYRLQAAGGPAPR
ncbi:MAG TPA: hypothetical protein VJM10_08345 [Candidatus Methylomirabilis sp.]|nr:hypothetical protein [Candidatus Methylomirabilis sp.]